MKPTCPNAPKAEAPFWPTAPCGCPYQPMAHHQNPANTDHGPACADAKAKAPPAPKCVKVPHTDHDDYLHDESDDRPYDVDGVLYCGRCHWWCPNGICVSKPAPPENVSEPPIEARIEIDVRDRHIDALIAENAELRAKVKRYEDLILQEELSVKQGLKHGGEFCKCFLCWEARAIRAAREGAKS